MIADSMPHWLWQLLRMDTATLPTDRWTWRHFCRYGHDPAQCCSAIPESAKKPRPTPWLFR